MTEKCFPVRYYNEKYPPKTVAQTYILFMEKNVIPPSKY